MKQNQFGSIVLKCPYIESMVRSLNSCHRGSIASHLNMLRVIAHPLELKMFLMASKLQLERMSRKKIFYALISEPDSSKTGCHCFWHCHKLFLAHSRGEEGGASGRGRQHKPVHTNRGRGGRGSVGGKEEEEKAWVHSGWELIWIFIEKQVCLTKVAGWRRALVKKKKIYSFSVSDGGLG